MGDLNVEQMQGGLAESGAIGNEVLNTHAKPWLDFVKERLASAGIPNGVQDDAVRDFIKQEVQGALIAISSLRYQHNILHPVGRLPPELLSRIFHEVSLDGIPNRHYRSTSWLAVTYVCRIWRSTALDSASLWTEIPICLGRLWSQAFVLRSKSAPLSVSTSSAGLGYSGFELTKTSWLYDLVKESFSRLATVKIHGTSGVRTFLDLLESSTPRQLRSLSLKAPSAWRESNPICLVEADQLQSVYFDRITLAWHALPWSGLRTVEVIESPTKVSTASDFPSLVASLQSATVLENLKLGLKSCSFDDSSIATNPTVAQLSRLRVLSLTGYAADCRALLAAVQIPASASLHIDMQEDDRSAAELSMLSDLLRAHSGFVTSEPPIRLQTLALEVDSDVGKIQLRTWRSCEDNPDRWTTVRRPFVCVNLHSKKAIASNMSNIFRDIDIASLRRLYITFSPTVSENALWKKVTWHRLFASAKKVQVLDYTGHCAYQLLRALSIPHTTTPTTTSPAADSTSTTTPQATSDGAPKRPRPPRSAMMFPALQRVLLASCACDASDHDLNKLPAFVKRRMRSAPFKTLEISACTIGEETVGELGEIKGLK
ncbi:hypothetical protein PENSPDRAFT_734567, partial [Peniophora sp. CONT]